MEKIERHEMAECFRHQIARPTQRKEAIQTLLQKESYDESDKLRVKLLFKRVSFAEGCETEYLMLVERLYKDDALRPIASEFYRRWMA